MMSTVDHVAVHSDGKRYLVTFFDRRPHSVSVWFMRRSRLVKRMIPQGSPKWHEMVARARPLLPVD